VAGGKELGLVKQFSARCLLEALTIVSLGRKGRPTGEQLERLPMPAAWALFLADVERHPIDHVEVTVAGGGKDWRHRWQGSTEPTEACASWSLDVAVHEPSGTSCRLRVSGRQEVSAAPLEMILLTDTLRTYAQHWARHGDASDGMVGPLGIVGTSGAVDSPPPPSLTTWAASGDDFSKAA
jgi:hypothetical protein